jgi:hypothetical protein
MAQVFKKKAFCTFWSKKLLSKRKEKDTRTPLKWIFLREIYLLHTHQTFYWTIYWTLKCPLWNLSLPSCWTSHFLSAPLGRSRWRTPRTPPLSLLTLFPKGPQQSHSSEEFSTQGLPAYGWYGHRYPWPNCGFAILLLATQHDLWLNPPCRSSPTAPSAFPLPPIDPFSQLSHPGGISLLAQHPSMWRGFSVWLPNERYKVWRGQCLWDGLLRWGMTLLGRI